MPTLVDSGAQASAISKSMVEQLGLPILQLDSLLELEGFGGVEVPYLGYTKANFQVPGVQNLNEDGLFLVQNDSSYSQWVPILIGTIHIDAMLDKATKEELENLPRGWHRGSVGRMVMQQQAQLTGQKLMSEKVDSYIMLT